MNKSPAKLKHCDCIDIAKCQITTSSKAKENQDQADVAI